MKIKIPLPEKISSNKMYAGVHWATRKKWVDTYHTSLIEYRNFRIENYPVDITYIFTFKSIPLDTLNCSMMAKMLEDGMRKWGILQDDSPKFVQFSGIYSKKGTEDSIEIIIT
jgi:hypothetical protein